MENTGGSGEDVLMQILVWLPVKSLLRFKSVCKSWHALIDSSFFIDLHTTAFNSSSFSKFGTLILQAFEYSDELHSWEKENIKMFMLSSGDGDGGCTTSTGEDEDGEDDLVFKVDDLGFLPFYKDFQLNHVISMIGSCNGLICLHDSKRRDVYLWNPATRQFRILPKSIPIEKELGCVRRFREDLDFVAFGFDVKTKDYKVVWITYFFLPRWDVSVSVSAHAASMGEEEGCMCRVQVYSLSTDSWRLLEGINSLPVVQLHWLDHGIYMNGSYFFVGRKTDTGRCNDSLMLSFDFTKEIFNTMQFPDHDSGHRMALSYLGDKMVVFLIRNNLSNYYYKYDIWVLNDHGSCVNNESWTKLHSFRNNTALLSTQPEPIYISNKGEVAFISNITNEDRSRSKLRVINLVTKEAQKVFTIGHWVLRANVYKQSLVSIFGGNGGAAAASRYHRGAM